MPSCPATARGGRTAWVPMALSSAPWDRAATNGGMPGAATVIWPPPPMRARNAEGPPSNVKILASMPYLAKMPVSWATHTGMCTRLGGVVGMANPTILSFGCAAPDPTVTARKTTAASAQIDRPPLLPITHLPTASCAFLLVPRDGQPGRDPPLQVPQGPGQRHAHHHQHDDRHKQPVHAKGVRILHDHVTEPRDGGVEFGDHHPDQPAADGQPDPGQDKGRRRGQN